jgi:hypothetical protein
MAEVKGSLRVRGSLEVGGDWGVVYQAVGYDNSAGGNQAVADTTLTYITGLTQKDFPDEPDGVKTYLMTAVANFIHTNDNGYVLLYLYSGPGAGLDTEASMRAHNYVPADEEGQLKVSGIVTPGVDEKASVAIQTEAGGLTIQGGGTHDTLMCTLVITRLT